MDSESEVPSRFVGGFSTTNTLNRALLLAMETKPCSTSPLPVVLASELRVVVEDGSVAALANLGELGITPRADNSIESTEADVLEATPESEDSDWSFGTAVTATSLLLILRRNFLSIFEAADTSAT
jgi:hypothetical protein